jgi:hypothetical protein|tara:strand:+ start:763 stop:963 length:201 start_codon:yes stop_codon:yes gene_type:complete
MKYIILSAATSASGYHETFGREELDDTWTKKLIESLISVHGSGEGVSPDGEGPVGNKKGVFVFRSH